MDKFNKRVLQYLFLTSTSIEEFCSRYEENIESRKMFLLLNKIKASDFFLEEEEFQASLDEFGVKLHEGYPTALTRAALEFMAIEACIPGDIVEYTAITKVDHQGYGDING